VSSAGSLNSRPTIQPLFLVVLVLLGLLGVGVMLARTFGKLSRLSTGPGHAKCTIPEGQKYLGRHFGGALTVAFAPDNRLLASGGGEGLIKLWDTATGEERAALTGHTGWVETLVFSPDGNTLLSGGGFGDGTIRLWDVPTAAQRAVFRITQTHGIQVSAKYLAVSSDGKTLAVGVSRRTDTALFRPLNGEVALWDLGTGQQLRKFENFHAAHLTVAFTPDNEMLACLDNTEQQIWLIERATGKARAILHLEGIRKVYGFGISSVGKTLSSFTIGGNPASTGMSQAVTVWDLATYQSVATFALTQSGGPAVAFSSDCKTLATVMKEGYVRLWALHRGGPEQPRIQGPDDPPPAYLATQRAFIQGPVDPIYAVCIAPDGKMIAYACSNGAVILADVK